MSVVVQGMCITVEKLIDRRQRNSGAADMQEGREGGWMADALAGKQTGSRRATSGCDGVNVRRVVKGSAHGKMEAVSGQAEQRAGRWEQRAGSNERY